MLMLIGNILSLIASLLMVYTGTINNRKKIIIIQIIYTLLFSLSDLLLGGFSGAIINMISILRNILSYNEKLGLKEKIVLIILALITTSAFNNLGLIGILPFLSMVMFILFMNTKDIQKFKLIIIFSSALWVIYDFTIRLYVSSIFDILTILSTTLSLVIKKKEWYYGFWKHKRIISR